MKSGVQSQFKQRGVAMILVIWIAMLLTVMAASFAFATRTDMSVLQNSVLRAKAEAAADAGVHRAVFEQFKIFSQVSKWKNDGSWYEVEIGDAVVRVSMRDESAKIDINVGAPLLIKGMFLSVGVPEADVAKLVEAMQDWRDSDDLTRPNGAEAQQYQEAGLKHAPGNVPFQTIADLRLVLGMSAELFQRIEPMITIFSRQPGVNQLIASRAVLLAIPGVTAEQVDAYIAQRDAAQAANLPVPQFTAGALYGAAPTNMGLSIESRAKLNAGGEFARHAVVRMQPDPKRPFAVLVWEEAKPGPVAEVDVSGAARVQ